MTKPAVTNLQDFKFAKMKKHLAKIQTAIVATSRAKGLVLTEYERIKKEYPLVDDVG